MSTHTDVSAAPGAPPQAAWRWRRLQGEAASGLRLHALEAWHLLSLDAPTVATVWLLFAAHCCHVPLPAGLAVAMFLLVWMLYALDRLLDARAAVKAGLDQQRLLAARHIVHHRHRRWFGGLAACAAVALVPLIAGLPGDLLRPYAGLGAMLLGWLVLVHRLPRLRARLLKKELAVGVFFAPAVFMPELAHGLSASACAGTLLLLTVCALNTTFIEEWEAPAAHSGRARAIAVPLLLVLVCLAAAAVADAHGGPWQIFAALALAAVLLTGLDRFRQRLSATTLRAAADLALLTPLLFGLLR